MRERLEKRLAELRGELEQGERMVADLQARQNQLRETLLRISGAVQVLEEELERADGDLAAAPPAPAAEPAPPALVLPVSEPIGPGVNGTGGPGVPEEREPAPLEVAEPLSPLASAPEPTPTAWP
jgi:hypothetical protein